MQETIRPNICAPYSLHDMCVSALEAAGDTLILRTQSGFLKTGKPCRQVDGHVAFHDVRWDFCYAYVLDFPGNEGTFTGEKMFLKDFTARHSTPFLTVMDETYGFNCTKYTGYFTAEDRFCECVLEICHEGDMVFVEETEYRGMAEVILSHDGEAMVYSVPAEVAENLRTFCLDFADGWVWHGPENGKFLRPFGKGQIGAVFGAPDFIDYLNHWVFTDRPSTLVKGLGCCFNEIPEAFRDLPRFNF